MSELKRDDVVKLAVEARVFDFFPVPLSTSPDNLAVLEYKGVRYYLVVEPGDLTMVPVAQPSEEQSTVTVTVDDNPEDLPVQAGDVWQVTETDLDDPETQYVSEWHAFPHHDGTVMLADAADPTIQWQRPEDLLQFGRMKLVHRRGCAYGCEGPLADAVCPQHGVKAFLTGLLQQDSTVEPESTDRSTVSTDAELSARELPPHARLKGGA